MSAAVPALGDHDQVELARCLFQDIDHVPVHVMGVQPVDADGQGLAAPIEVVEGLDDVLAGLFLVIGGDRVFKVEKDHVRRALGRFFEKFRVRARHRQFAAVEARRALLDDGETHNEDSSGAFDFVD